VDEDSEGVGAFLDALHAIDADSVSPRGPTGSPSIASRATSSAASSCPCWTPESVRRAKRFCRRSRR
jgi:hypothetical protein